MNPEYEIYEQIDLYLSNQLSPEAFRQFNERLAKEESLRELVEAQKTANEFILDQEMIRLKERMKKDLDGGSQGNSKIKILVSTLLLAVVSFGAYQLLKKDNTTENIQTTTPEVKSETSTSNTASSEIISSNKENTSVLNNTSEKITNEEEPTTRYSMPVVKEETKTNDQEKIQENTNTVIVENNIPATKTIIQEENKKFDCSSVKIEADTRVDYGYEVTDITLTIDKRSVKGGTPPYSYALDQGQYGSSVVFKNLEQGIHTIHIKDKNDCFLNKFATAKFVEKAKEIDEAFSPSQGQKWPFPLNNHQDASVSIISKAGTTVYTTRINGGYPGEWDGRDNNGGELETGNYYFIINFANNEIVKGHITIIR